MRNPLHRRMTTALVIGLSLTGVASTARSASAVELAPAAAGPIPSPPSMSASVNSSSIARSAGWLWAPQQSFVFSEYGGPSTIGSTAAEFVYAYCQSDGAWGWWTYAWVPSMAAGGWIRNTDLTGYTNPIWGLDYC